MQQGRAMPNNLMAYYPSGNLTYGTTNAVDYQAASSYATNITFQFANVVAGAVTSGSQLANYYSYQWPMYSQATQGVWGQVAPLYPDQQNLGSIVSYGNCIVGIDVNYNYEETAEMKAAREIADLKRENASKRAEELLLMVLGDKQKKQYLELGYFETIINDKTYRINKGRSGNVQLIEKGLAKAKYCIHPTEFLPDQDTMLAQYLMLKSNEDAFLKTANRTVLY